MNQGGAEATYNLRRLGGPNEAWGDAEYRWHGALHNLTVNRTTNWVGKHLYVILALILATAGCRTLPPLPAANLSEPGWNVRQGQAIWRNRRDSPEIAGEVLLATRTNGTAFVQFTKTPFPLVIAQRTADAWQIEIPTQNKRYAGRGGPPKRMIWFLLAQVLSGQPAPANWSWRQDPDNWRLENKESGESLEGFFATGETSPKQTP